MNVRSLMVVAKVIQLTIVQVTERCPMNWPHLTSIVLELKCFHVLMLLVCAKIHLNCSFHSMNSDMDLVIVVQLLQCSANLVKVNLVVIEDDYDDYELNWTIHLKLHSEVSPPWAESLSVSLQNLVRLDDDGSCHSVVSL